MYSDMFMCVLSLAFNWIENERKMQYKRKRKAFPISTVIFMK